jgi:hypothetical protein
MKKVFLGGTMSGSDWRKELVPMLKIDYLDDCDKVDEKATCDFLLYVITPEMKGFCAVAEAVQSSNRQPEKTIVCILNKYNDAKFGIDQGKSIGIFSDIMANNGAKVFLALDLSVVAEYLNQYYVEIKYDPNVVECLIERDGPTPVTLGKTRYTFKKNDAGHSVCPVMLRDHRNYLTSLPDFRIYMKDKLPEPEFTDEEMDFMREWKFRSADSFLAYVNGRIDRFNRSRDKVKAIAIEKWKKLLPKMECPVLIAETNKKKAARS